MLCRFFPCLGQRTIEGNRQRERRRHSAGDGGTDTGEGGALDSGAHQDASLEAGPPVYCNLSYGPLEEYDGDPKTALCEPWEVCVFLQGVEGWHCIPPDQAP